MNPLVARLIDAGKLAEIIPTSDERQGVGRPRAGLAVEGPAETIAVVTWGHGLLDLAVATYDRSILWRERSEVSGNPTPEQLLAAGHAALATVPDGHVMPPSRAVFGIPVPYEQGVGVGRGTGEVNVDGFASWFSDDPQAMLSEGLGVPVHVANDANLGALGEARFGAAADERVAIYIKMSGSGIGCGLTIDGRLFSGSHGYAGEIAHMRVDDDSRIICSCGSRGCLDEKIGPNMLRQLRDNYGPTTYADLLRMVGQGLPGPSRLLKDAGRVAGRALADICTFFNPGSLVIDAGSPAGSIVMLEGVREQVEQSTPPFSRRGLRIVPTHLGEEAAIHGAVEAARQDALTQSP
ncbi:MAG: ROK family protein [Arachnia sp.]